MSSDGLLDPRRTRIHRPHTFAILSGRVHKGHATDGLVRMSVKQYLPEDDVKGVNDYAAKVLNAFSQEFKGAGDRFVGSRKLLQRFTSAVDAVLENGWSKFHEVDSAHNELCIASSILSSTDPVFTHLEYEPPLAGCTKSIDFRGTIGEVTVYVDVKTIQPSPTDRWDQFVKFEEQSRFPERVLVFLEEEWLGGELWHNMYASRERMLEHTLGLERKISDGNLAAKDTFFVLALCGHEFHWDQSDLEDFVTFYYTGFHRPDDPLSTAEAKYVEDRHLSFARAISRFACMFRSQLGLRPLRLNWRVVPPPISWA